MRLHNKQYALTITTRGEAYMQVPKMIQRMPTMSDLLVVVWVNKSTNNITTTMKTISIANILITFN